MMIHSIVEEIKKNPRLKDFVKFVLQFFLRNPTYFFYSTKTSFKRSLAKDAAAPGTAEKIAAVEHNGPDDILLFRDVISFPLGPGKIKNHTGGIADGKTFTLIPEAIHFNGDYCQELPPFDAKELVNARLPEIRKLVMLGGLIYNNFGHFLLESLGRLWAYNRVKELDPLILFYPYWGKPNYFDRNNFVYQALTGFRIPVKRLLFTDEISRIQHIIVPAQKYGYEFCKRPEKVFVDFIKSFTFPRTIPHGFRNKEKIYVSRARLHSRTGRMIGEALFEGYLASNGYTMFYPEKHTLYEQLSVYSQAKQLVFADGGALHGCILLPELRAEVAVISRRRDTKWIPIDILDQFTGYGKDVLWVDAVKEQYQFGLDTWNAIAVIDWYSVSQTLKQRGFTQTVFDGFREIDYDEQIRKELRLFLAAVNGNYFFLKHMATMHEPESGD